MSKVTLDFAHICDFVSITHDGKLNILGVFDSLEAPKLPNKYSAFYVVASVSGAPGKYDEELELKFPGEDPISIKKQTIEIDKEGNSRAVFVARFRDIPFTKVGIHTVIVRIDNEIIGERRLEITSEGKES